MSKNSIFKMICYMSDYTLWDETIHENVLRFHKLYSIYPNIMLASKNTWDKIDEFANLLHPDSIIDSDDYIFDEDMDENGIKPISSFESDDYTLHFCVDEKANENYFFLVFDEDPIFDGEPYEYDESEDVVIYRRIA